MAESPCGISTGTSTGASQVELFTSDTTKLDHAALQHTCLVLILGFIVDITHSTALLSPSFLFHLTVAIQNLIYLIMGLHIILSCTSCQRTCASRKGGPRKAPPS
ncbi:hypothetical protein J3E69DRAFT_345532 [Trichoderma sp. SZMC 28015]